MVWPEVHVVVDVVPPADQPQNPGDGGCAIGGGGAAGGSFVLVLGVLVGLGPLGRRRRR